ncbi:hypothetical protein [Treponema putidum]|uniref:hypothetical protein n=1 Tax=Treponema putidum TaxID=221027 RepID=UPI0004F8E7CA|nr:hypothetical protein [Treponema putidum]AIN93401.1 hypothetical protein JO40_04125 [Treponema putidum]
MEVVTICGSMRFANEMKKIALLLEKTHHMSVLQCVYNEEEIKLSDEEIKKLNEAHYRKIQISDAIYVVNLNGYIGEQVKREIAFAEKIGKKVIFHSNFYSENK